MNEQAAAMLTHFENGPPPKDGNYYLCFCYETDALVALQYMWACSIYSDKADKLHVRPNLIVSHYPTALAVPQEATGLRFIEADVGGGVLEVTD